MGRKPYANPDGDYLDMMRMNDASDYGNGQPKRKKPYQAGGDFLDMEHFHFKNFESPYPSFGTETVGGAKVDTVHWVDLVPLTGDSSTNCEADPDGTRKFAIRFMRTVNDGDPEQVPFEETRIITHFAGEHVLDGTIVTVDIDDPGEEYWTFGAEDLRYEAIAASNIWVREIEAHKYWRLDISAAYPEAHYDASISEIDFRDVGEQSITPGTITASDEMVGFEGSEAFDDDTNTYWATGEATGPNWWIQSEYAGEESIFSYRLKPPGFVTSLHYPIDWTLEWSDNGTDWTIADTRTGITWTDRNYKTFTIGE